MPGYLPDTVQQQLGWLPVPADDGSAAIPQPDESYPLHPAVLQGLGLPPLQQQPEPPPLPQVAQSIEPPAPIAGPLPVQPDVPVQVPEQSQIAPQAPQPAQPQPQPQQARSAPQKPQIPAGQLTDARAQQIGAQQDAETAAQLKAQAELQRNAEVSKVYDAHAANAEKITADIKAQQDELAATRAKKEAFASAAVNEVENFKIDRSKFGKEMGPGGALGWGVAILLSSIGDALLGKAGQPNPVITMMQQSMAQNVQSQMEERDRLKGKAAGAAHALDKFDAFSKDKMAQRQLMLAQNDKMLADYIQLAAVKTANPATLAKLAGDISALRLSAAEKAQKAAEYATKLDVDQKQLGVSQVNAQTSRLNHNETVRHNLATEDLAQQSKELEAIKLERAGKTDEAKLIRERAIGGEATVRRDAKGNIVKGPDGKPVIDIGTMTNKDGSVFIPKGTETNISRIQKAHATTLEYVQALDRIRELGPEWMSDIANTEKKQQLKQQIQTAKNLAIRMLELGVPTGKDVEMAENFIGANDVTGFRDVLGGINESRRAAINIHNNELKTAGYDRPWTIADPLAATKSPPTPGEERLTALKTKPAISYDNAFKEAQKYTLKEIKDPVEAVRAARKEAEGYKVISPSQARGIKELEQAAMGGDQSALSNLEDLSKRAGSGVIEALAGDAAKRVRRAIEVQQQSTTTDAGPVRTGYDPEALVRRFNPDAQWGR